MRVTTTKYRKLIEEQREKESDLEKWSRPNNIV